MITVLVLALTLTPPELAEGLGEPAPSADSRHRAGPDSVEWGGFAVVEPRVRAEIADRWDIPAEDLRLDWGAVRQDWEPTRDASVVLQGSGRNGYWIVRLHEGDQQLAIRLRAASTRLVMVAARPLERGATLRREDVAWEHQEVWGPPDARAPAEPGWTVRRRVRAGETLSPPRVTPPDAVESGAPVTVEWVGDAVAITLPGKALGTVPVGEPVYVRTDTGERLRGTAVAPGRVRVSSNR